MCCASFRYAELPASMLPWWVQGVDHSRNVAHVHMSLHPLRVITVHVPPAWKYLRYCTQRALSEVLPRWRYVDPANPPGVQRQCRPRRSLLRLHQHVSTIHRRSHSRHGQTCQQPAARCASNANLPSSPPPAHQIGPQDTSSTRQRTDRNKQHRP